MHVLFGASNVGCAYYGGPPAYAFSPRRVLRQRWRVFPVTVCDVSAETVSECLSLPDKPKIAGFHSSLRCHMYIRGICFPPKSVSGRSIDRSSSDYYPSKKHGAPPPYTVPQM